MIMTSKGNTIRVPGWITDNVSRWLLSKSLIVDIGVAARLLDNVFIAMDYTVSTSRGAKWPLRIKAITSR